MSDATKRLINAAEWVVTIFTDDTLAHERGNLDDWLHELNEAILEVENEQQSIPVATVVEYCNKTKSISWRDRDLYSIPGGTVLYAQKGICE